MPGQYVSLDPAPLRNGFYIVAVPWNLRIINMALVVLCACLTAQTVNEHLSLAALLLSLAFLAAALYGALYCFRTRIEYNADTLVCYTAFRAARRFKLSLSKQISARRYE